MVAYDDARAREVAPGLVRARGGPVEADRVALLVSDLLLSPGVLTVDPPLSVSSVCLYGLAWDPQRVLVGLRVAGEPHLMLSGHPVPVEQLMEEESVGSLVFAGGVVAGELEDLARALERWGPA